MSASEKKGALGKGGEAIGRTSNREGAEKSCPHLNALGGKIPKFEFKNGPDAVVQRVGCGLLEPAIMVSLRDFRLHGSGGISSSVAFGSTA